MEKRPHKWLSKFYNIENYKKGILFNEKMNNDLQIEFEKLTNKRFNGNDFFLFIRGMGDISYYENVEIPYGRLKAMLLIDDDGMDVNIIWFDRATKKLFKPGDDIIGSELEFHWENLNVNHPLIKKINNEPYDIRKNYGLKLSFPVLIRNLSFDNDFILKISLPHDQDALIVERIISDVQNEWNSIDPNDEDKFSSSDRGLVHSVRFEGFDDEKRAIYHIDIGTAGFDVILYLLNKLELSQIKISLIELVNN